MGGVRIYRGIREPSCHVRVIDAAAAESPTLSAWLADGRVLTIPRELIQQETGPFDWGADGAGTHYLAVAILADLLGPADRGGIKAALPFMRRFLGALPRDEDFEICESVFRAFLRAVSTGPAALPALPGKTGAADTREGAPEAPGKKSSPSQQRTV